MGNLEVNSEIGEYHWPGDRSTRRLAFVVSDSNQRTIKAVPLSGVVTSDISP